MMPILMLFAGFQMRMNMMNIKSFLQTLSTHELNELKKEMSNLVGPSEKMNQYNDYELIHKASEYVNTELGYDTPNLISNSHTITIPGFGQFDVNNVHFTATYSRRMHQNNRKGVVEIENVGEFNLSDIYYEIFDFENVNLYEHLQNTVIEELIEYAWTNGIEEETTILDEYVSKQVILPHMKRVLQLFLETEYVNKYSESDIFDLLITAGIYGRSI